MRADRGTDLEHDGEVTAQRNRTRVAAPAAAVDEGDDALAPIGAKSGQLAGAQTLAPQREERADGRRAGPRPCVHVDDATRVDRAQRIRAPFPYRKGPRAAHGRGQAN